MNDRNGILAGQTVIVTGGGSGIGRATALRAAREGASVAVLDRDRENAEETATMVGGAGGTAGAYPCDVSNDAAVAETVGAVNADLDASRVWSPRPASSTDPIFGSRTRCRSKTSWSCWG